MNRWPVHLARRRPTASGIAGFTLVEVLLVCALAATLLAGAWAWAWTVAGAGGRIGEAAETRTSLAYVRRMLLADLRATRGLDESSPCSSTALALAVPTDHHAAGRVVVSWNRERGVLWRVAPACHLADGVELFIVRYVDAAGCSVGDGASELLPEEKRRVAGVVVSVRVRYGQAISQGSWPAWFEGPGP